MTKKERREQDERLDQIYCGILYAAGQLEEGEPVPLFYHFFCPEFAVLRRKYGLEKTAGRGGEFAMALRLCRWLAPNLLHEGDFFLTEAQDMPMNSLALLEYGFGRKDRGLNCACKAKILTECCLALGIHARRVGLYPASPYDADNHVVTEIFDRKRNKWCMLDPTNGGYFTDGVSPLSCLEMRERLAERSAATVVLPKQSAKNLSALKEKNAEWNLYYAKNCFYFTVETVSGFGSSSSRNAYLLPRGFDVHARETRNERFMLEKAREWNWGKRAEGRLEQWAESARERKPLIGGTSLWSPPALPKT